MSILVVSSKGQVVLPVAARRRLGLCAGARLEMSEEVDGLRLRVLRAVSRVDVTGAAGMLKARSKGVRRRLEDFDPATMARRGAGSP